ncbi:MAG: hypothetical protein P0121_00840 [Nitrospira sp.]|nr:hypothetical protein [Nitrospira sp.]
MKNQATNALVGVEKQPAKPKKKPEKITFIEVPPDESWFQHVRGRRGFPIWFLRLQMTGLRPRRYGPFDSQRKGLLFLDQLLGGVGEALCSASNELDAFQTKGPGFSYRGGHYPIVEDEVIEADRMNGERSRTTVGKKGR